MVDILLIQPPMADFLPTAKRTIPYGLASIAAAVMQKGFSVDILDAMATGKSRIIPARKPWGTLSRFMAVRTRAPLPCSTIFAITATASSISAAR